MKNDIVSNNDFSASASPLKLFVNAQNHSKYEDYQAI